ncbi:hypothetical protein ACPXCG_17760 [Gordonia sp. DT218]|uniref:hypothetical protein n=1 Tax=Gordonia sp. DT218 TaxID=3416659 RepID=UPI003CEF625D
MKMLSRGLASIAVTGAITLMSSMGASHATAAPTPAATVGTLTCSVAVENPHFSKGAGQAYVIAKARVRCTSAGAAPVGTLWVTGTMFGPGVPEVTVRSFPARGGLNETMYIPEGHGLNTAEGNYPATAVGTLMTNGQPPLSITQASRTAFVKRR